VNSIGRVGFNQVADHQPVEEHAQGSKVLFHSRGRELFLQSARRRRRGSAARRLSARSRRTDPTRYRSSRRANSFGHGCGGCHRSRLGARFSCPRPWGIILVSRFTGTCRDAFCSKGYISSKQRRSPERFVTYILSGRMFAARRERPPSKGAGFKESCDCAADRYVQRWRPAPRPPAN
jgi:hypothetical protein